MKKILYLPLLLLLTACSKDDKPVVYNVMNKAEEYVLPIRSLDVSLSKLYFDKIHEKTMTSHEEYSSYLANLTNSGDNQPVYPVSDLVMSKTKFERVLTFFGILLAPNISMVEIGDKFYELHYKLSFNMQGGWRFVIIVSKDMQVLNGCANLYGTTTKECLQNGFDSVVGNID